MWRVTPPPPPPRGGGGGGPAGGGMPTNSPLIVWGVFRLALTRHGWDVITRMIRQYVNVRRKINLIAPSILSICCHLNDFGQRYYTLSSVIAYLVWFSVRYGHWSLISLVITLSFLVMANGLSPKSYIGRVHVRLIIFLVHSYSLETPTFLKDTLFKNHVVDRRIKQNMALRQGWILFRCQLINFEKKEQNISCRTVTIWWKSDTMKLIKK